MYQSTQENIIQDKSNEKINNKENLIKTYFNPSKDNQSQNNSEKTPNKKKSFQDNSTNIPFLETNININNISEVESFHNYSAENSPIIKSNRRNSNLPSDKERLNLHDQINSLKEELKKIEENDKYNINNLPTIDSKNSKNNYYNNKKNNNVKFEEFSEFYKKNNLVDEKDFSQKYSYEDYKTYNYTDTIPFNDKLIENNQENKLENVTERNNNYQNQYKSNEIYSRRITAEEENLNKECKNLDYTEVINNEKEIFLSKFLFKIFFQILPKN